MELSGNILNSSRLIALTAYSIILQFVDETGGRLICF